MNRRVVLDDPRMDTAHMSIDSAARLTGWLAGNGFARLNGDALADFLRDRIRAEDAYGSVVVLSRGMVPAGLLQGPPKQPLWLEYLRGSGRIVNVGDFPFFYCQYPTSRPPPRDQAARGLALLGFHFGWDSPYWGQSLRVRPNPRAKDWGPGVRRTLQRRLPGGDRDAPLRSLHRARQW
jgi:hypothetical protein